jgi:adenine deaminase
MPVLRHNYIDLKTRNIYPAEIQVEGDQIIRITELHESCEGYLLPGFIDAHIHIESSMLTPCGFAPKALEHGTLATVSDPHEIANVMGLEGVEYMLEDAKNVPLRFFFGAPSCVPATTFETAGAVLSSREVAALLAKPEIKYLSEMMNYPGVLHEDPEVMAKIQAAQSLNKPVDGHAPGLTGAQAAKYASAGISTDHECFTLQEALNKIALGMKILIREGSAAKNFEALHPLIGSHPDSVMFCSDDKHPDDLLLGHINQLVARSLQLGYDLFDVLNIACKNPSEHYNLELSDASEGSRADFIVVDNLREWMVSSAYLSGEQVVSNGKYTGGVIASKVINNFQTSPIQPEGLHVATPHRSTLLRVIEAIDGELITNSITENIDTSNLCIASDNTRDILKLVVVNRYENATPAVAFIRGFGLKSGAIAGSVGHDSHNITAVGTNDEDMASAINAVIENKGGLAFAHGSEVNVLPLPVAGLMSNLPAEEVAKAYSELTNRAKAAGSTLNAPYMTLSFMSLLVIPDLKLSDKGLFSGTDFSFVPLIRDGEA